jgi:pimeloyl-ACP methyl ester carboxylesterase
MWDSQFAYFAQHYQVIRYDLRGFGQSSLPTGPYAHVDDLLALLDHLNLTSATLVGLSRGGSVALDFTLTHPQRVEKLVLVDSVLGGYRWSTEQRQLDQAVWEMARTAGIPAGKAAWLRHPLFAPALEQPTVTEHFAQMVNDYSGWHFLNRDLDQRLDQPAAQRLSEVHCPTLIVVGERDLVDFLQIAEQLADGIPGAQKILLSDVGHMANMEAPAVFNAAVLAFLTRNDTA